MRPIKTRPPSRGGGRSTATSPSRRSASRAMSAGQCYVLRFYHGRPPDTLGLHEFRDRRRAARTERRKPYLLDRCPEAWVVHHPIETIRQNPRAVIRQISGRGHPVPDADEIFGVTTLRNGRNIRKIGDPLCRTDAKWPQQSGSYLRERK